MSKARQLADLGSVTTRLDEVGNTDGALSNRNMVLNGSMAVSQRGVSFTNVSDGQYCLDRWVQEHSDTTFDLDITQDTGPIEEGFPYSLKATVQTTATLTSAGYILPFEQRIEFSNVRHLAYGTAGASTLTLSFWIKSNRTGNYTVDMTKGGPTRSVIMPYSISSAGVWEKKTLTIPPDAVVAISGNVTLFWWMIAGSTYTSGTEQGAWSAQVASNRAVGCSNSTTAGDYWQITGVQLEQGDQSTPFEHRSYSDELQRCQRYFSTSFSRGVTPAQGVGNSIDISNHLLPYATTTGWVSSVPLPEAMRSTPSITIYRSNAISSDNQVAYFDGGWIAATSTNVHMTSEKYFSLYVYGSFTANRPVISVFRWTADAEL